MNEPSIISVSCDEPLSAAVVEACRDALVRGALVIIPSETVYGIAADARNPDAEKMLFRAKLRSGNKPIALLVHDCGQIERWGGKLGPVELRLAKLFWPGPLTMVLPVEKQLRGTSSLAGDGRPGHSPPSSGGMEGFRIPDHPVIFALLRELDFPLRATSANIAGEPAALTAEDAAKALGASVELVLDAGPAPGGVPSTVIELKDGGCRVLREGAIPGNDIMCEYDKINLNPASGAGRQAVAPRGSSSCERPGRAETGRRRILIVCTGNLCRSPMAEYLLRHHLGEGSEWDVESAGTHAITGVPASEEAVECLRDKNIDLSPHRSRPLTGRLVQASDMIVTMTESQAGHIRTNFPEARDRVFTLKSFDPGSRGDDIRDPIGSSRAVYEGICIEIEEALVALILHLKRG